MRTWKHLLAGFDCAIDAWSDVQCTPMQHSKLLQRRTKIMGRLMNQSILAPHLDASIQVAPTSVQCEMRNAVVLTLCVSSYSEFDLLIHKTIYKPISTTRYRSLLVHRSLGLSPHEVWMVERSTPALRWSVSWIHKVHQILWKGQSYDIWQRLHVQCVHFLHALQCLSGAIHRSPSYQTQRGSPRTSPNSRRMREFAPSWSTKNSQIAYTKWQQNIVGMYL